MKGKDGLRAALGTEEPGRCEGRERLQTGRKKEANLPQRFRQISVCTAFLWVPIGYPYLRNMNYSQVGLSMKKR